MMRGNMRLAIYASFATFVFFGGCTVTSMPTGGSYKSAMAQTTIRLAIHESFHKIKLPEVKGKAVSFTTVGFDGDQDDVREYLRMYGKRIIEADGGRIVSEKPEVDVNLIVNTCGVDASTTYIIPFWMGSEEQAYVNMDLNIKDSEGKILSQNQLKGRTMFIENRWLLFISTPGFYQIRRDNSWVRVNNIWADWKTIFDMPFSTSSTKQD